MAYDTLSAFAKDFGELSRAAILLRLDGPCEATADLVLDLALEAFASSLEEGPCRWLRGSACEVQARLKHIEHALNILSMHDILVTSSRENREPWSMYPVQSILRPEQVNTDNGRMRLKGPDGLGISNLGLHNIPLSFACTVIAVTLGLSTLGFAQEAKEDKAAVRLQVALFQKGDSAQKRKILDAWLKASSLCREAIPCIRKALSESNPDLREKALELLLREAPSASENLPALLLMAKGDVSHYSHRFIELLDNYDFWYDFFGNNRSKRVVVPYLLKALSSDSKLVRYCAANVLRRYNPGESMIRNALIQEALQEGSSDLRRIYAHAPAGLSAFPALEKAYATGPPQVRVRVLRVLKFMGDKAKPKLPFIARALREKDPDVRYEAREAWMAIANTVPMDLPAGTNPALGRAVLRALYWEVYCYRRRGTTTFLNPFCQDLVRIGRPAVPILLSALSYPMDGIRAIAADALGCIGDMRAVEPLLHGLRDESAYVRRSAATALSWLEGDAAIPHLMEYILGRMKEIDDGDKENRSDEKERQSSEDRRRTLGYQYEVELVVSILRDFDSPLSRAALKKLAKTGLREAEEAYNRIIFPQFDTTPRKIVEKAAGKPAIAPLRAMLKETNPKMRYNAALSLLKIDRGKSADLIVQVMSKDLLGIDVADLRKLSARTQEEKIESSPSASDLHSMALGFRINAARLLGRLGHEFAIPALAKALDEEDRCLHSAAAKALGRIGTAQATIPLLKALTSTDRHLRLVAVSALECIGDPKTATALIPLLKDGEELIALAAIKAMRRLGSKEAIEPLQAVFSAALTPDIKRECAHTLYVLQSSQDALDYLMKGLENEDCWVRLKHAKILAALGAPSSEKALRDHFHENEVHIVCLYCAAGLVRIRGGRAEKALDFLIRQTHRKYYPATTDALDALATSRAPAAAKALADLLESAPSRQKSDIIRTLGLIGHDVAVPALEKVKKQMDEDVRKMAERALRRIRGEKVEDD